MTYEHPLLGFALALPDGWRAIVDVPPTFVGPAGERGLAPTVVVTAGAREDAPAVAAALRAGRLLDHDGNRALMVHAERDVPTVLEQWWFDRDGRAWALSASCDPLDYDELADAFAAVAASFRAQ
jgi:hypothetical protein